MNDIDTLFLSQLLAAGTHNREKEDKVSLRTSSAVISPQLLKDFGVSPNTSGAWFFNVYVEFEPLFKVEPAKDWQK